VVAAEVKDEKLSPAVDKDKAEGGGRRGRGRGRSGSRSRKKKDKGVRGDSDSDSRSRSRSRSRKKKSGSKRKHKKKQKKRRRSSSSSSSDSDEAGWERKFLATAMENAQKARMGAVPGDPSGGGEVPGPGAGVSGNKAIGRFFDNQGRFINPAGGFNPSGAPRRIPKEHGQWGDWECEACGGHNRKHRTSCFTCFVPKPMEAKSAHYTTTVGGRQSKDD
jgi:hypothetical protein